MARAERYGKEVLDLGLGLLLDEVLGLSGGGVDRVGCAGENVTLVVGEDDVVGGETLHGPGDGVDDRLNQAAGRRIAAGHAEHHRGARGRVLRRERGRLRQHDGDAGAGDAVHALDGLGQFALESALVGHALVELGLAEALVVEQVPAGRVVTAARRDAGAAGGDLGVAQRLHRDLDRRSGVGHLIRDVGGSKGAFDRGCVGGRDAREGRRVVRLAGEHDQHADHRRGRDGGADDADPLRDRDLLEYRLDLLVHRSAPFTVGSA